MEKSKVYFTDFHATIEENLLQKLGRLVKTAGIENIDFKNQYTVIKIHFGEPGNLAYLRPNYAKVIVDLVKSKGSKVFLSDCNTLYVGRRKDALEHLDAAYENGYNPFTLGCQLIIGDGLKGTDEQLVNIDQQHVKQAKIGRAIMDADIFISLTHFKGHEGAGFGGTIKNIGMGCGSRAGKMEMHSGAKPQVEPDNCVGCRKCLKACANEAIEFDSTGTMFINNKCVGCGRCVGHCNFDVISTNWEDGNQLNFKMAEYALAVVKDRPQFHISLICDVSPDCDCHGENDLPIVGDIGMLASFDPVALDQACADLVNQATPLDNSRLAMATNKHSDHFSKIHPTTDWHQQVEHGQAIGLGTIEYQLIKI